MSRRLDLVDFLPKQIITHDGKGQTVNLKCDLKGPWILLRYITNRFNGAQHRESMVFPRWITNSRKTWEVLGLLQAECSKTQRGCFTFANSDPGIINAVLSWYAKELGFDKSYWRWYIKINISPHIEEDEKLRVQSSIIPYWLKKTNMPLEASYPKSVVYSHKSAHKKRILENYGCFTIEYRNNLFTHVMHGMLDNIMGKLVSRPPCNIIPFLRGVIAGEGCVVFDSKSKHYNIHISAAQESERIIYKSALASIGIKLNIYDDYKETIISRKENLKLLDKFDMMSLHHEKNAKFQAMMSYLNISDK